MNSRSMFRCVVSGRASALFAKVKRMKCLPTRAPGGIRRGAGALLRQGRAARDLGAAPGQLCALVERYHIPLAKMVFDTDIYLKMQSGGYLGGRLLFCGFSGDPTKPTRATTARLLRGRVPSPDPAATSR